MKDKLEKCLLCKYIKEKGFPFGYDRKRYFLDTEGCFYYDGDHITIKYCPKCGKKLLEDEN